MGVNLLDKLDSLVRSFDEFPHGDLNIVILNAFIMLPTLPSFKNAMPLI